MRYVLTFNLQGDTQKSIVFLMQNLASLFLISKAICKTDESHFFNLHSNKKLSFVTIFSFETSTKKSSLLNDSCTLVCKTIFVQQPIRVGRSLNTCIYYGTMRELDYKEKLDTSVSCKRLFIRNRHRGISENFSHGNHIRKIN